MSERRGGGRRHPALGAAVVIVAVLALPAETLAADPSDLDRLRATDRCPECDLTGADLGGERLAGADLGRAKLGNADLRGADLTNAILDRAVLFRTDLRGADLTGASLKDAELFRADLRGALLVNADLRNASLWKTELADAELWGADLAKARYEPVSVPRVAMMALAEGLSEMYWTESPAGLNLLRAAFKNAGMRQQEREVTYAINRSARVNAGGLEGAFRFALFEITCDYGMSPGKPIRILLTLILVFAVPYMAALSLPEARKAGIWRLWSQDRIDRGAGQEQPERLVATPWRRPLWALYFSVLSAFHVGWRDLNVGNWIARIQPQEFTLRATGWVRAVSGVQSLISVYLFALWALTYFGRPFE